MRLERRSHLSLLDVNFLGLMGLLLSSTLYKHIITWKVSPYGKGIKKWRLKLAMLIQHTEKEWHPTSVLLPGKSHGRRSLVGCSPWGLEESDTTERLHFHFSLSCIGEGNGNPLQCSCLENPRDSRAWWAAVYGVAQSRTRLKRLSSSSSNTT